MYKPSKFNYFTKNKENCILAYNSFKGSFVKISNENAITFIKWLDKTSLDEDSIEFNKLKDKGFFILENEDEDEKINLLYSYAQSNKILSLIILTTEQCNFRCTYCYEEFKRGKMSLELQNAIVKFVKRNIHSYAGLDISWFGGEPLLGMDVIENLSNEFIKICKSMKRSYTAGITTNGYLLDLETFKKLLKYNVLRYQITIDGLGETQNKQKPLKGGGETFDVVIDNLKSIKNNVKTGRFVFTIRTNFTLEMYNEIDKYIEFYNELLGDDQRFQFLIRSVGDWGGDRVKDISDNLMDTNNISKMFEKFINADKTLNYNTHKELISPLGSVCYASQKDCFIIDADGNIRKCTCNLEDMTNNNIGKLNNKGYMEVDEYKLSQWIFREHRNKSCNNCFYLPACLGNNCPSCNNIYNCDLTCPNEKLNIDSILRLLDRNNQFELIF